MREAVETFKVGDHVRTIVVAGYDVGVVIAVDEDVCLKHWPEAKGQAWVKWTSLNLNSTWWFKDLTRA